jgi:hypothetical protein
MQDAFNNMSGRIPYKAQLPTSQQIAAMLAILALAGPMAMGGMPVLPVTIQDEQRRRQDEIQQVSESNVGVYQTSTEAATGLALSQLRLAHVAREVEGVQTHDVTEQDVIRAAKRVFTNQVEKGLSARFRSAFSRVVNDSVDLYILQDNEQYAQSSH